MRMFPDPKSGQELHQEAESLQRRIAKTEAVTKDGLPAQAQLLADLHRHQAGGHLARAIVDGIKRLVPDA